MYAANMVCGQQGLGQFTLEGLSFLPTLPAAHYLLHVLTSDQLWNLMTNTYRQAITVVMADRIDLSNLSGGKQSKQLPCHTMQFTLLQGTPLCLSGRHH
jgi:hypothetical protein